MRAPPGRARNSAGVTLDLSYGRERIGSHSMVQATRRQAPSRRRRRPSVSPRLSSNGAHPASASAPRAEDRVRLRHVTDAEPGIRRLRSRGGFEYEDPEGNLLSDEEMLARIRSLAIPPAWEDVWIGVRPEGHLQATGRDAKGRKQYRYHPAWRDMRDETKYGRLVEFGEALPRIRRRVDEALNQRGLPRERVVATVVRLLDTTGVRIGNPEYARENGSYGLTTLRNKHVEAGRDRFVLSFRAKSGKQRTIHVRDPRLARIVRRCRELPGYELFQYLDEEGERQVVGSGDVNDFIRESASRDFTAKDFRTWWGTVLAATAFRESMLADGAPSPQAEAKRRVNAAIEHVAGVLGNTVAVARKAYVHPSVVEAYLDGEVMDTMPASKRLSAEERGTLSLLRSRQA